MSKFKDGVKDSVSRVRGMKKRTKIIIAILLVVVLALVSFRACSPKRGAMPVGGGTEYTATYSDITSSITGTATIQPRDQYSISSLVSGEVMSADFEEGDMVEEDQLLFQIDSSDIEKNLRSANISLQQAQNSYNDVQKSVRDLKVASTATGKISVLHVKKGDSVQAGGRIATVYDDSYMELTLPFNEGDAAQIMAGSVATVYLTDVGGRIDGTVLSVGNASYIMTGNRLVRDVKIRIQNPGTVTPASNATAVVGNVACANSGTFVYQTEKIVTAKTAGEVVEINIDQGNYVTTGQTIVTLESENLETSVRNSALSLENSQINYEKAMDNLDNYTIKAPIAGTVVAKNFKAGDKLDTSSAGMPLAIIYDLSSMKLEMNIDELDIHRISKGQEVNITADALDGKSYIGTITNVSINGTSSGGVTTYPITVEITQFDEDLLPGMNVDVEIVVEKAEHVLAVPVGAVVRGNVVYVKGEKTDEKDHAPEGFKSVLVTTGVYNNDLIEITSGILEGDVVYAPLAQGTSFAQMMQNMMGGGRMSGGGMPSGGRPAGGGGNAGPR